MLKISAEKIAHAIACAREHDAVAGSWDSQLQQAFYNEPREEFLYSFVNASGSGTLAEFISSLTQDEQASLLAIAWIGRGAFSPAELDKAIQKARNVDLSPSGCGLMDIPLLAEYLHEGMEKLGFLASERDSPQRLQ